LGHLERVFTVPISFLSGGFRAILADVADVAEVEEVGEIPQALSVEHDANRTPFRIAPPAFFFFDFQFTRSHISLLGELSNDFQRRRKGRS
jgi:hypothetical protein